jgi:hypothetical protein
MEFQRPNFEGGNDVVRDKLNRLVNDIFRSVNIRTGKFLSQTKNPNGMTIGLNLEELRQHLAIKRGGGAGAVTIEWAKVIQQPQYADPESFSTAGGRPYYTLRSVTSIYADYVPATAYVDDTFVVFPATVGSLYKSKGGTGEPPVQSGHQPDTSPDYWELQDEIKVEYALGADTLDLRRFTPWYAVGEVVPVISRSVEGVGTRVYIWAAQTYGGEDDQASLRWNSAEGRAMACYS